MFGTHVHRLFIGVVALVCFAKLAAGSGFSERAPLPHALSDLRGEVLSGFPPGNQTRIVIVGGCSAPVQVCPPDPTASCYCPTITANASAYDPNTDTWTILPPAPIPRYRHSAFVKGTKLYVLGGRTVTDPNNYTNGDNIISQVDVYDSTTNAWTTVDPWPYATSDFQTLIYNDAVYAIGGYDQNYNSLSSTSVWFPNGTWTNSLVAPMLFARGDLCSVMFEGEAWVFGGFDSVTDPSFCTPLTDVSFYNFTTNTWRHEPNMTAGGGDKTCAVLHGQIHVFGGEQKDANCSRISRPIATVEEFDPPTNRWSLIAPMAHQRFRFLAVQWLPQASGVEQVFLFGGQGLYNETLGGFPVLNYVTVWTDDVAVATTASSVTAGYTTGVNGAETRSAGFTAVVALVIVLAWYL